VRNRTDLVVLKRSAGVIGGLVSLQVLFGMSLDKPSSRWKRECPPNTTAKQRKYVHGRGPKRVEDTRDKLCCQRERFRERFCDLVAGGPTRTRRRRTRALELNRSAFFVGRWFDRWCSSKSTIWRGLPHCSGSSLGMSIPTSSSRTITASTKSRLSIALEIIRGFYFADCRNQMGTHARPTIREAVSVV